ncbi:hypothetical protein CYY_001717 [Polysphondylium violaceum]|uniref:Uncharacterized protein n=1 Tax=Polysphondylium violaceum TaxID=133409 RepID=A0A8J4V3V4_9MYCE|nr:hypothetical protein CYY_001717 [Polysphondylium violaceum]
MVNFVHGKRDGSDRLGASVFVYDTNLGKGVFLRVDPLREWSRCGFDGFGDENNARLESGPGVLESLAVLAGLEQPPKLSCLSVN